jgi:hypothetical protein
MKDVTTHIGQDDMDIKIDPTDYIGLKTIKAQLAQVMEVVDFALKTHGKRSATSAALANGNGHDDLLADTLLAEIMPSLPPSFTSAAVSTIPGLSELPRASINAALERAARGGGSLRLVLKSAGRRPAKYEKVG